MKNNNKTREQLLNELEKLKTKIAELEKSEEQFRLISENTSDNIGITTFDLKAKYIYVSPSIKSVLGYDPEDLLGKSFFDFIHSDDKKVLFPLLKKYVNLKINKLLTGKESTISETIEFRFKNKTGNWRFMQSTVNIVGKQFLAVTRDITERKKAEEALRESEEKFRAISESAIDSIFIKDIYLKYIHVNPAMEKLFGLSASNLIGKTDIELFGEKTGKYLIETDKKVIKGEILIDEHKKAVRGKIHSFHTIKVPLKNSKGKIIGLCGIARDITEKNQAEESLRESEHKFRDLANLLPQIVYEIDINGNLTFVNNQAFASFGYSEEEYEKGINVLQTLIPEDIDRAKENIQNIIYGKDVGNPEYTALRKDGSTFPILIYSSAILKDNKPVGLRGIIVDITERKQAEDTLNRNLHQQKLLTEVSYLFTKLGKFEKNMNDVLRVIGKYTKVSRVYIFEDFNNGEYTKNTYEWCNRNIESQIENLQEIPYSIVSSWKKILNEEGMVFSTNISELPQDIKVILEPQKIQSILVLPIYVKDQFFGFMGFDECESHRVWDNSEIDLLKTVANVISTIFERRQAEEALKASNENFQQVVSNITTVVWKADIGSNGTFENTYSSPVIDELLGLPAGTMKNDWDRFFSYIKPEYLEQVNNAFREAIISPGKKIDCEYEVLKDNGQTAWFHSNGRCFEKNGKLHVFGSTTDITERKRAERELQERMNELETFYRATLGREGRVIELKQEVNELLEQIGKKKKYGDHGKSLKVE